MPADFFVILANREEVVKMYFPDEKETKAMLDRIIGMDKEELEVDRLNKRYKKDRKNTCPLEKWITEVNTHEPR